MNANKVLDKYMPELILLDNDAKITLIEHLLISMKANVLTKPERPDVSTLFSGDWENDVPAAELADQYRASRYYDADKKIEW